ncbi:hypothetical protein RRG08_059248 [Elysia crispata]|uniref:Uncharacterized protein n=1 Tax=Elysia crispata TaxID=231223 RepID=A0AAE1CU45_9GAST|nr:hypothetical protein RRG08_059248 [Elysia crispata]
MELYELAVALLQPQLDEPAPRFQLQQEAHQTRKASLLLFVTDLRTPDYAYNPRRCQDVANLVFLWEKLPELAISRLLLTYNILLLAEIAELLSE